MKIDLRAAIIKLDPSNAIALNPKTSPTQLKLELVKVRQKIADESAGAVMPATVKFRVEDTGGFSWKIEAEDHLGPVEHGETLPDIGSRSIGDDDVVFVVTEHELGLTIRAGDLPAREEFDPRRIYKTKSDHEVVYKRVDPKTGKAVLWSFRQGMEIVVGNSTEIIRTDRQAKPVASSTSRTMTQKIFASWAIANNPSIKGAELTEMLKAAFKSAKISNRHGPHYLSQSRCGNLPEAPEDDPRNW